MRSTAIHFLRNDQGFRTRFHIHPLVRLVFPSLEKQRRHQSFGQVLCQLRCFFFAVRINVHESEFCHPNTMWEKKSENYLKMNGWNLKLIKLKAKILFQTSMFFRFQPLTFWRVVYPRCLSVAFPDSERLNLFTSKLEVNCPWIFQILLGKNRSSGGLIMNHDVLLVSVMISHEHNVGYLKLDNQGSLRDGKKSSHKNPWRQFFWYQSYNRLHQQDNLLLHPEEECLELASVFGVESVNHQVLNDALDCIRTTDLLKRYPTCIAKCLAFSKFFSHPKAMLLDAATAPSHAVSTVSKGEAYTSSRSTSSIPNSSGIGWGWSLMGNRVNCLRKSWSKVGWPVTSST